MDNILDNIDLDIENNRTIFLKESDPFLPIIPSPEIQEEPLEERLRTPPATPIHSPHAFLKEDRWLFSPPPVLTSEHAKLNNSEIGLNLTPNNIDKRRKSPALCKVPFLAIVPRSLFLLGLCVNIYIVQLWGMLRECTLGSSRVLHFYQHKIYNYNTCSCCTS